MIDFRATVRKEIDRFARATRADPNAQVVHCPDWSVADLTWHMCGVLRFWRAIGTGEIASPQEADRIQFDRVPDTELAALLEDEAAALTSTVYDLDPTTPVWTWSSQQNVGFIQRRMAQESAVHRWDAENAIGTANPIDADLAVDGIDEFLTLFLPAEPEGLEGPVDRVRLVATDRDVEWTVAVGEGKCEIDNGPADVIARADAEDMLLLLWTRRDTDVVSYEGDVEVLDRFLARTDLT